MGRERVKGGRQGTDRGMKGKQGALSGYSWRSTALGSAFELQRNRQRERDTIRQGDRLSVEI